MILYSANIPFGDKSELLTRAHFKHTAKDTEWKQCIHVYKKEEKPTWLTATLLIWLIYAIIHLVTTLVCGNAIRVVPSILSTRKLLTFTLRRRWKNKILYNTAYCTDSALKGFLLWTIRPHICEGKTKQIKMLWKRRILLSSLLIDCSSWKKLTTRILLVLAVRTIFLVVARPTFWDAAAVVASELRRGAAPRDICQEEEVWCW